MGQKTHPVGFRVGVIRGWSSRWFAQRGFADLLIEDLTIKRYIGRRLENAGIAKIEIVRQPKRITVDIHTSRPGIVIGRKGAEVDKLREELQLLTKKDITLNIIEVKRPELRAQLVGDSIARQLEGRVPLHTLRADIDFARSTAHTAFGTIGVKVWIFKGEVLGPTDQADKEEELPSFGRERERGRGPRAKKPGARSRRKRPEEGGGDGGDGAEE